MKLTITQEHIDHGMKQDCLRCPIALALQEAYPSGNTISVDCENAFLLVDGAEMHFVLPREAVRFIGDFDDGKKVLPFTFELEPQ